MLFGRTLLWLVVVLFSLAADSFAVSRIALQEQRLDSLQAILSELKEGLDSLKTLESSAAQRLETLRRRLSLRSNLLEQTEQQLEARKNMLILLQQELAAGVQRLDSLENVNRDVSRRCEELQRAFAELVRNLYVRRSVPLYYTLLNTTGVENLMRRGAAVRNIRDAVQRRSRKLRRLQNQLEKLQVFLALENQRQRRELGKQTEEKRRLHDLQKAYEAEIADLREDRAAFRRELNNIRNNRTELLRWRETQKEAAAAIAERLEAYRRASRQGDVVSRGWDQARSFARSRLNSPAPAPPAAPPRAFPGKIPWPARGEIVSRFGRRRDPDSGLLLDNPGIDLEVTAGTPVEACADGKVVDITWLPGYGNTLMLAHANSYLTVYAGLETLSVQGGQTLVQGQQLGTSGGRLHFEVWRGKQKLDPRKLLAGH